MTSAGRLYSARSRCIVLRFHTRSERSAAADTSSGRRSPGSAAGQAAAARAAPGTAAPANANAVTLQAATRGSVVKRGSFQPLLGIIHASVGLPNLHS